MNNKSPEGNKRVEQVLERQEEMMKRMDRLLQQLMQMHQPKLTENELKWFKELERFKEEVLDDGTGRSLSSRVQRVRFFISSQMVFYSVDF